MQYSKAHGEETADKIFRHCTNGHLTTTIARGDLVKWDTTDNRAVAGIMRSTWGTRVVPTITSELTGVVGGFLIVGAAEQTGPPTAANQTRNDSFLVQCSGFHDFVKITGNTTTLNLVGVSDVAASVITKGTVAGLITTAAHLQIVGMAMVTATAPGNGPVLLRGLM